MKLNKKQKRTATIASMAALLAVVLGMGGQTFAKYISTKETDATATVAKWGFVANAQNDLFSTLYDGTGSITTVESNAVIVSEDTDNIVAPGAKGQLTFSVIGTAEVDAIISIDPGTEVWTEVTLWEDDANVLLDTPYLPMNWELSYSEDLDGVINTGTVEGMENIYDFLNDAAHKNLRVEAGVSVEYSYTLSWNWEFHVDDATDLLDSYLGYMNAGKKDALPENYNADDNKSVLSSTLSLTVSATQTQ